jgi:hypothetical protein
MAGRLAAILDGVHQAGVVHKDLNPGNMVLADTDAGPADDPHPTLIDFDLATTFAEERPGFRHHREVVGTLKYLTPEQTGQTGWPVDHRADLYALGATLYELATGRPPFRSQGDDPLELLHAHLALLPVPPEEIVPDLPGALSLIILRLLEKEPDRRYQSAQGLRHDLAQLEATLLAGGSGAGFPLGRRDFPSRFAAPSRLVGRDGELAVLHDTYREVLKGGVRGLCLAGAPGVGKTSLLDELRPLVTASGGWFVTGKFDQYRRDADALTQAMRALGRLLLAEPRTELEQLRQRLLTALGADAGLLTGMPEFAALLAVPAAEPPRDAAEACARLHGAAREVLRCTASPQRPVVCVLDDLQWATSFAVAGVDGVLTDEDLSGVLLVGAYRDTEVDVAHPLTGALARWQRLGVASAPLRLLNLPPDSLATMLADLLRLEPGPASELAEAIGARTAGNPYDSLELVNALRRDGSLALHEDGWRWSAVDIRPPGPGRRAVPAGVRRTHRRGGAGRGGRAVPGHRRAGSADQPRQRRTPAARRDRPGRHRGRGRRGAAAGPARRPARHAERPGPDGGGRPGLRPDPGLDLGSRRAGRAGARADGQPGLPWPPRRGPAARAGPAGPAGSARAGR